MEALGRLAGRGTLARLVPHLYDPDVTLRNVAIHAVVSIEQRATAAGESLDPAVQAALRREDLVDHLLTTLRRGRAHQPPHGRGDPGLAQGGARGAPR